MKMTVKEIKQLLKYEDGLLYWRPRTKDMFDSLKKYNAWKTRCEGKIAGGKTSTGYVSIEVNNFVFRAHRAIWAMHNGKWPNGEIDHINHNRSDNRIENLREVNRFEQMKNKTKYSSNNTGTTGVVFVKKNKNYRAHISCDGKMHWLGTFNNKDDAIAARKKAEVEMGYHQNHGKLNADD